MTHRSCKTLVLAVSFVAFTAASHVATTLAQVAGDALAERDSVPRRCQSPNQGALLFDDFNGPDLRPIWQASLPSAPWRFEAGIAAFQGASGFTFGSLGGASVIRLHNLLNNAQRRGWSSSRAFNTDAPVVYEARFNTLVQSSTTAIDELLEIWLLDANNPGNYDLVALSTPNFGRSRIFTAGSSISGVGLDTEFPFNNNTWYRMVISGSKTREVRASIYDDARSVELIGVSFAHDLSAYAAGFKVGISQSMGQPGSPFPTAAAVDWIRLTTPRSGTVVIDRCNTAVNNPLLPSGCTISDLVSECAAAGGSHDEFVGCVSNVANDLKNAGTISGRQRDAIESCATRANVP